MYSEEVFKEVMAFKSGMNTKQNTDQMAQFCIPNSQQKYIQSNSMKSQNKDSISNHSKQVQQQYQLQQMLNWNLPLGKQSNYMKERSISFQKQDENVSKPNLQLLNNFLNTQGKSQSNNISTSIPSSAQQIEQILANFTLSANTSNISSQQPTSRTNVTMMAQKNLPQGLNPQQKLFNNHAKQFTTLSLNATNNKNDLTYFTTNDESSHISHKNTTISSKPKLNHQGFQSHQSQIQQPALFSPKSSSTQNIFQGASWQGLKQLQQLQKQNVTDKEVQIDKSAQKQKLDKQNEKEQEETKSTLKSNISYAITDEYQQTQSEQEQLLQNKKQNINNFMRANNGRSVSEFFSIEDSNRSQGQKALFEQLSSLVASSANLNSKPSSRQEQQQSYTTSNSQQSSNKKINININLNKTKASTSSHLNKNEPQLKVSNSQKKLNSNEQQELIDPRNEDKQTFNQKKSIPNPIKCISYKPPILSQRNTSQSEIEENKQDLPSQGIKKTFSNKPSPSPLPQKVNPNLSKNVSKINNTNYNSSHNNLDSQYKLNTLLKFQFSANQDSNKISQTEVSQLSSIPAKNTNDFPKRNSQNQITNPTFQLNKQQSSQQSQEYQQKDSGNKVKIQNNVNKHSNISVQPNNNNINSLKGNSINEHVIFALNPNNQVNNLHYIYNSVKDANNSVYNDNTSKSINYMTDTNSLAHRSTNLNSTLYTTNSPFVSYSQQFYNTTLNCQQYSEGQTLPTNQSEVMNKVSNTDNNFPGNLNLQFKQINQKITQQKIDLQEIQKSNDIKKQLHINLKQIGTSQKKSTQPNSAKTYDTSTSNNHFRNQTSTNQVNTYYTSSQGNTNKSTLQSNLKSNQFSLPGSCTIRGDHSTSRQIQQLLQLRSIDASNSAIDAKALTDYRRSLNNYSDFVSNIKHPFIFAEQGYYQNNKPVQAIKEQFIELFLNQKSPSNISSWKEDLNTKLEMIKQSAELDDYNH